MCKDEIVNFLRKFEKKEGTYEYLANQVGTTPMTLYRWKKGLVKKRNKVIEEKLKRVMKRYRRFDAH